MADLLAKIRRRPTHPMSSAARARELLAEHANASADKAIREVTPWLESLTAAEGFDAMSRFEVVGVVDDFVHARVEALMSAYLDSETTKRPERYTEWHALISFWERLSEAYLPVVEGPQPLTRKDKHAGIVIVRTMRAVLERIKLSLIRYAATPHSAWKTLYSLVSIAEHLDIVDSAVRPYDWTPFYSSPRREIVRAVMLEASAPQSLPSREIALCDDLAARLAKHFTYAVSPAGAETYYIDLAGSSPPTRVHGKPAAAETLRFFGPGTVIAELRQYMGLIESGQRWSGADTQSDKLRLKVMDRLLTFWSSDPPRRREPRIPLNTSVEALLTFQALKRAVPSQNDTLSLAMTESDTWKIDVGDQTGMPNLASVEKWQLTDISTRGLGLIAPVGSNAPHALTSLTGFKIGDGSTWTAGVIRRVRRQDTGLAYVGVEVLSKNPCLLWLVPLKKNEPDVWAQAVKERSFSEYYINAILLCSEQRERDDDTLAFEPGCCAEGDIYGTELDGRLLRIRIGALLEKGSNFARHVFEWVQ